MFRRVFIAAIAICPAMSAASAGEIDDVVARFVATYPELCDWAIGGGPSQYEPEVFEGSFNYDFEDADDEPRPFNLYRIHCYSGAYNRGHVFFSVSEDGILPVQFAVPAFTATFLDQEQTQLDTLTIDGINVQASLVNSEIDAETLTVTMISYWRGVGDASSTGRWEFDEGQFKLVEFTIDPTYDGEITPITVVENGMTVPQ